MRYVTALGHGFGNSGKRMLGTLKEPEFTTQFGLCPCLSSLNGFILIVLRQSMSD